MPSKYILFSNHLQYKVRSPHFLYYFSIIIAYGINVPTYLCRLINSLTTLSVDKTEVILKRSHLFNEQSIQKTISILSKVHQGNIFVK